MELSSIVLQQVIIIVLLMLAGFTAVKTKLMGINGVKEFTSFLLYFVTPCVLIEAYQKDFDEKQAKLLLVAFLMALVVHIIVIVIATLVFPPKKGKDNRVNIFACVYSNCGFMAIPLLSAALGQDGVFFGGAYLAVFSILQWTHGVFIMSSDKRLLSFKKVISSPGVWGTAISLLLFVFQIKLPYTISQTVSYIADLNTPLAMIILGTYLVGVDPREVIKNKDFYLVTLIRLIVAPIIAIYLLKLLGVDITVIKALAISSACPVAGVTTLWAARLDKNAYYGSQLVSITTIVSVVTIPFVMILI